MSAEAPLLKVENLVKYFPVRGGILQREVGRVHAVDGVSFIDEAGDSAIRPAAQQLLPSRP